MQNQAGRLENYWEFGRTFQINCIIKNSLIQFTELKVYKLSIVRGKYVGLSGKLSHDTGLKNTKKNGNMCVCRQDSLQITRNKAMKEHGIHNSTATRWYKGETAEDEFKVSQRGIVRILNMCFFICFAFFAYLFLNWSFLLHTFTFEEFLLITTENKSLYLIADSSLRERIGRVPYHSCVYLIWCCLKGTNNVLKSTETHYNTSVYYFLGICETESGPLSHFRPYFKFVDNYSIVISVTNALGSNCWKERLTGILPSKHH